MATEILPVGDLAAFGLVEDTPSAALPPNAFSDVLNVRFLDGAVRKFPGESAALTFTPAVSDLLYVATWNSPAGLRLRRCARARAAPVGNALPMLPSIVDWVALDSISAPTVRAAGCSCGPTKIFGS